MTEIICNANKCAYNSDGFCVKDNVRIKVNDSYDSCDCTCCDSFNDDCNCDECHCSNRVGDDSHIECSAEDCIYNENSECTADAINIGGSDADKSIETFCGTYTNN